MYVFFLNLYEQQSISIVGSKIFNFNIKNSFNFGYEHCKQSVVIVIGLSSIIIIYHNLFYFFITVYGVDMVSCSIHAIIHTGPTGYNSSTQVRPRGLR